MTTEAESNAQAIRLLVDSVQRGAEKLLRVESLTLDDSVGPDLQDQVDERTRAIAASVNSTAQRYRQESIAAVTRFARWMRDGTTVRVLGAGRARLAAAIPANRLAHGGAHVFLQDDIVPMPHSVRGGGIIAASASGTTAAVLTAMRSARSQAPNIEIIGIASHQATEFADLCHIFIGIVCPTRPRLSALADIEEYVISETLDALVVAAGEVCGYDDRAWRLGHENLGSTGPYDARKLALDLYFTS